VGAVSPETVANALSGKHLLLVLDNCEHVVGAAAGMAEALLQANPAAQAIATSREPLKAEGEWVYPVPPLTVPPQDAEDGDDPLRYSAVRLFVVRRSKPLRQIAAAAGARPYEEVCNAYSAGINLQPFSAACSPANLNIWRRGRCQD
jgi:predicted ATPase